MRLSVTLYVYCLRFSYYHCSPEIFLSPSYIFGTCILSLLLKLDNINIAFFHYIIQDVLSTTLRQIMSPLLIIAIITDLLIPRHATESSNSSLVLSLSLHSKEERFLPTNK